MKKIFCFVVAIQVFLLSSCPTEEEPIENNQTNNPTPNVETGKVTFFNESSYSIIIHLDSFSGVELLQLSAGQSKKTDVRTSDNHGIGTTFSIEYLYKITNAFDTESGEVIASGIDPNVQINFVVEKDKTYTKQIPQPQNLEFKTAFVKILNSSSLPFELKYLGTIFKQTGNGNISVAPGKTGVYKLEGIPSDGKLYHDYRVTSTFESTVIPDFTAVNGKIYNFTYNGTSVTKTGESSIIFK